MAYRSDYSPSGSTIHDVAREPATVLVATDGSADADHALALAHEFAQEDAAAIHVISVCELGPDPVAWPGLVSMPVSYDAGAFESARIRSVRDQIERVAGEAYWPITVTTGVMSLNVADAARDVNADLVLTGRGRHKLSERILGEEHLLKLIRESPAAVLAAEDTLQGWPRRIAIGVDFAASQRRIAQSAARWADTNATIFLVHARPRAPIDVDPEEWYPTYDDRARADLERLKSELDFGPHAKVLTRVVEGHAGQALCRFCQVEDCDLIVTGAQGTGFVHRLVVGSVTTYLLRHAACSLLTIPVADA